MIPNAISVMTLIGLIAGVGLAVAKKIFYVAEDPKFEALRAVMPGLNCGLCGYAGCDGAARALVAGKTGVNVCTNGGRETTSRVAGILGLDPGVMEPVTAGVGCFGGVRSKTLYHYDGIRDCRAACLLYRGPVSCEIGCLGLGSCVRACPFDAIHMGTRGLPEIDEALCRGCGKCAEVCPRGVITLGGFSDRLIRLNRTSDCLAPCRQKCPAQVDVPKMIRHIRQRHYDKALLTIKEMTARKNDVTRAMEEGVEIMFTATPIRIFPDSNQRAASLEVCQVEPCEKEGQGSVGRKIPGSQKRISAALVISAYERKPDMDCLINIQKKEVASKNGVVREKEICFKSTRKHTLEAKEDTLMAAAPNIFTAGDMHTGRASVINAVAGGRKAARSIHLLLTQGVISVPDKIQHRINTRSILKKVCVGQHTSKVMVEELPVSVRKTSFVEAVGPGITQPQAMVESTRCLQCGTTCNDD